MKKLNFLVLGVGGNVSQGIVKSLRKSDFVNNIHGACVSKNTVGYMLCDTHEISPYSNSIEFSNWLINCCNKNEIDIILSGVEEVIVRLDSDIDIISSQTNAIFVSPGKMALEIGQDKYKTAKWLKDNGLNYPRFARDNSMNALYEFEKENGFPMLCKPKNGKASQGVKVINSKEELSQFIDDDSVIIQQYIGDSSREYTVGCYVSKENMVYSIIMRRELNHGKTVFAEVVQNESIKHECEKIAKCLDVKGSINIQLRLDFDNRPIPFEINSRLSGTTAIRANFGFRDVEALVNEYVLERSIHDCFSSVTKGKAFRYDEELYIYEEEKC
ncbi:carbamoyl-phosphate synthase L chain, ATP binding domain protein [Vibrio cholerae HC-46B1]|uniref:ATP-grasp domain-containing protein n=1 Tax=Vibrio cholerae TaxID=666 RepID=UPI0002734A13|nr:ATP-grasp domain-containing protein [Vibrio cholerae]EJH57582.1 rimK-like ATP-grasp domain protein [Vibrio cholerae HC-43B1]EKL04667.1 carbamoyl-phosphate synthase L chain, ATP binding domain protein [Vibrio cholerae HC-41B1]EKL98996.1 carbamoyl-phosphate synthase L chain, ATP binding domain protein [Vibrio cholerae HC-46B1]EKM07050.1 carbamoyl-phosphate synthase L chain, ATP binding domain protein [Vibrio cholerae HC-44C1]